MTLPTVSEYFALASAVFFYRTVEVFEIFRDYDYGRSRMHIFFSVGEPSGDQHAAHLIEELRGRRPDLQVSGFGGPLMETAGCRLVYQLTNLAVMGFFRVIPLLWKFYSLVQQAKRNFRENRPDAVVLVDFPGFNWWIARAAKKEGIPVFYYLPPQLWAWASWRIRRVRKFVDHLLCGLPFEQKWYAERGVKADYVGHPFFDEVAAYPLDRKFCSDWKNADVLSVGVLPGSRNGEIERNWPTMIRIMKSLHERCPNIRFLVASYKQQHRERCIEILRDSGIDLPIHFFVDKTPEIIESAFCCLMVSGSVSLEMLARRKPTVIMYRVSPIFFSMMRILVRLDSITLPNLIAGRQVFPEWVLSWFPNRDARRITETLESWVQDRESYDSALRDVESLYNQVVQSGATARAAELILARTGSVSVRNAA